MTYSIRFVCLLAFLTTTCVCNTHSLSAADRPNIVFIMADDMGYECIGANGCLDYKTPVIDKLAVNSLRFNHFYSQPICTPSRVKLMTGQSNKRNYVQFGKLDRSQTTFANILQKAGYKTCIAGKWQLGKETDAPQHFGFEQSLLWQHTRGRTGKEKRDSRYPNPRLERNGVEEEYDDGEFSTDLFTKFITDFMTTNQEQPFLVYYPMALVHCPFTPTPDSKDWDPKFYGDKEYKGKPQYFGDMVSYVDKAIGRIDSTLQTLGVRDNTLLIFTGDNGTDTPIVTNTTFGKVVGAKGQMVDAGNHVTGIVSWPNMIKQGSVTDALIDFSDMLPTMCQAAGTPIPDSLTIDGESFLPLLQGKKTTARESMFMWYSRNGVPNQAKEFARNQQYKLYNDGRLFDIAADRNEKNPLPADGLNEAQLLIKTMLQQKIDDFANVVPPQARNPKKKNAKTKDKARKKKKDA